MSDELPKSSPSIIKHQPLILVMGVSGCGKSTIAKGISKALQIPFIEADDFHPESNISKMKNGQSLNDDDRQPWLENLAKELKRNESRGCILACSALKTKYRSTLNSLISKPLQIVFLDGSFKTIKERIEKRAGHFMPSKLLQDQFDTLEIPQNAWTFNIQNSPESIIAKVLEKTKHSTKRNNHHG